MSKLDYIVISVFIAGVLGAGMSFSGTGKNMKSFFAGGGAVPWWINGLSLFMSFFSAGTFVAWGSLAYMNGAVSIAVQWTMCIAGFLIAIFIAARWRKTHVLTGSEFIGLRLGPKVQKAYTYLFMLISIFTSGAFLYPVAKIVEGATGIPFEFAVIGLGIAIILYTASGGLWAVIVTDVLQFIILSAAVLIIVPLAFDKIGGVNEFFSQRPDGFFDLTTSKYTPLFFIGFGLYNLCFIAGNWAYVQRYTSVATPRDSRKVALLFGALYVFCPVIWMLPPMIYRIYNPELDIANGEANHAYMFMAKAVLPKGMLGLMVGAMIFATASSVNTTLNILSGVFTNDVYKPLRKLAGDRELMLIARISTAAFGVLTMIVALSVDHMGGILDVVWGVAGVTGGAMYIPTLWALFSKVHTGKTVLGTTLICLSVNSFFKWAGVWTLSQAQTQALGALLPLALMLTYEIIAISKGKSSSAYDSYEKGRLDREVKDNESASSAVEHDEATSENRHGIKVIGIGIAATGILIAVLGAFASVGTVLVSSIGAVVAVIGFSILLKLKSSVTAKAHS